MARRGDELRQHILWAAKDVFLELGFERASMDAVAARAQTSKRTLYAHFENKERLFLAVIGLVRTLFLDRLQTPGAYPGPPGEALSGFCVRYLQALTYQPMIRMCRVALAETERFPEGAARHYDLVFTEVGARIAGYLAEALVVPAPAAQAAAERLLGRVLHPRLLRALFGLVPLPTDIEAAPWSEAEKKPVRAAVNVTLAELEGAKR